MIEFLTFYKKYDTVLKKIKSIACLKTPYLPYIVPCFIYCLYGMKYLGLPGLYMDSVNPDYLSAWIQRGSIELPAWIYPDNWIAGVYEFPLLNSLYGGNSTAYLAIAFFKIFGFGFVEVRLFHAFLGLSLLIAMVWGLLKWRIPNFVVILFVSLLASDPSFIYAWRTQYYLQLYPMLWFFIGVGALGGFFLDDKPDNRQVTALFAGFFMGFSAYSYFIYAIYTGAVVIICLFYAKSHGIKSFLYLLTGVFIGFAPYVYAHASIILNTDFPSYIEQLKGLQTAYGVVDVQQGGIIERLITVLSRLEQLVFGTGVESVIFGNSHEAAFPSSLVVGFLSFLFIFYRPVWFEAHNFFNNKKSQSFIYSALISTILIICILGHLIFVTVVGKPLQLQHYIMLIPLIYFLSAALFSLIFNKESDGSIYKIIKLLAFSIAIFTFSINIISSHKLSNRLLADGGNGLYSDAINTTGLFLESLPPETVLLFPQWGYWMGVVTITGPRHSVFYTPNLEEMENRLKTDAKLLSRNSFVLVLGSDVFQGNGLNIKPRDLAQRNGLRLTDITTIHGRNNIDKIILLHLSRIEN